MSQESWTPIVKFGPHDRAISIKEAAKITSLSTQEIERRIRADEDFPRPFWIGPRRKAFLLSDLMLWLAAKATKAA